MLMCLVFHVKSRHIHQERKHLVALVSSKEYALKPGFDIDIVKNSQMKILLSKITRYKV